MQKVSVIATVKNEGESIRGLLDSLWRQTRPPDEIVIVDGGSTDETWAILKHYEPHLPLRLISAPGANISQGRNLAIATAAGPLIAATDAGVVLDPDWLRELLLPFRADEAVAVVSGWFEVAPHSDFELAMGAAVLPHIQEIDPQTFLPSSRSIAFLKSAWESVGGYPEWLDYCEDLIFDFALRERFGPFPLAAEAIVYFRPRSSLPAFAKQYYRYARGDGKANLWWKRHLIRYATYLLLLPFIGRLWWRGQQLAGGLLLLLGAGLYLRRPLVRLWRIGAKRSLYTRLRLSLLIPIICLVGDVAKMVGYPVGLWWRWRHRN